MATVYFTNCNDTTDTTSPLYAGSLREAVANASAGDIIKPDSLLSGGTIYLSDALVAPVKIILDCSELAERLTIDGNSGWDGNPDNPPTGGGYRFEAANRQSEIHNVIFSHFAKYNHSGATLVGFAFFKGNCYNCDFTYCYNYGTGYVIGIVAQTTLYNCRIANNYTLYSVVAQSACYNSVIEHNQTKNNAYGFFYWSYNFSNNIFRNNTSDCYSSPYIVRSQSDYHNNYYENNLFVSQSGFTSVFYSPNATKNYFLRNNTIIGNLSVLSSDSLYSQSSQVANNLLSGTLPDSSSCVVANNYLYQTSDPTLPNYSGKVFVDYANGDYRLKIDSPALDAGDNQYITTQTDLAGNPRIVGTTVDCGAYENQAVPLVAPTIEAGEVKKYSTKIESVTSEHAVSYEYRIGTGSAAPLPTESGVGTVYNLSPSTTYSIQVRAVGDGTNYRYSPWSNAVSVQTLAGGLNFFVWEARRESSHADLKQQQEMFRASILDMETREPLPVSLVSNCSFTASAVDGNAITPISGFSGITVPSSCFSNYLVSGFNFKFVPDQVYKSMFDKSGSYSVSLDISLSSGNPISVQFSDIYIEG